MKLCFGTFARVLLFCGAARVNKLKYLNLLVRSVDANCTLSSNAVTGLLQCATNLPNGRSNALGNVISKAAEADPRAVAAYFLKRIVPLIEPAKRKIAVLALREIARQDDGVHCDRLISMVNGRKFVPANFLAEIFLYTTTVDNRIGKAAAELISDNFMRSFFDTKDSISFSENTAEPTADAYNTYLSNATEKYNKVKTLLYLNQPKPFYSLYVPNGICRNHSRYNHEIIKKITAKTVTEISNFIILKGMGGTGKTMMLRHLLLNAIEENESFKRIPIFISLKDYDATDLTDFIYATVATLSKSVTKSMFSDGLDKGLFMLLFDALDEINFHHRPRFEQQLETFTDKYSGNFYIISSRPYQSFVSFSRFTVLKIEPFTKEQAVNFIDKIEFRPDEPEFKNKFRSLIEGSLYSTHRSFIENPLLLTILLLTFEKFASIPAKMHLFYRKAFITLSETHDASKGSLTRLYKSGMTVDTVADYFSEFCFQTYHDSKFEFTDEEFEQYYDKLWINNKTAKATDFAHDICTNLCLMFYEGKYQFTHRSFQEYFCARFFSMQEEKFMRKIGGFFESRKATGDQTFAMLYDMVPTKVQFFIFTPFLQELFDKCDSGDGYWSYLKTIHPTIRFIKGDVLDYPTNHPASFLVEFILSLLEIKFTTECNDLPQHKDFLLNEYGHIQTDETGRELVRLDAIATDYPWVTEQPSAVGSLYEIDTQKIYPNRFYKDIREMLNNDGFIFKSQYNALRNFFEEIKSNHAAKANYFDGFFNTP
ncbi:MAG: NACHT domain-containing protein [Defluviitaleaceae bacterium]|nr:NACHT domain-containing protein [Defluviitaleaceae bacterium]MCL2224919.1 NACHT domain-containing protein [Defluviitaleaceae bacterium]MCL2262519.1 NACHT domain-containing protein [Defluviitaleaceae bacterium]